MIKILKIQKGDMMSNNAKNRLRSEIGNNQTCTTITFIARLAAVILITTGSTILADNNTAVEITSLLWVNDLESLDTGTPLVLLEDSYEILKELHTIRLTDFPISRYESVDLELEQFSITTPTTRIVVGTEQGDTPVAPPEISLFRGSITDVNDSRVVLGISPYGCHGFIQKGEMKYVINPKKQVKESGGRLIHVIHELSELPEPDFGKVPWCGSTSESLEDEASIELAPGEYAAGQFRYLRLALECDYEYWSQFNNVNDALEYIYILFGWGNWIYHRDVSVNLSLTFIRIWTTINDPYSDKVTGDPAEKHLDEFRAYWLVNHSDPCQSGFVERDLAHLLSSRGVVSMAKPGSLCDYSRGYSISAANHTQPTLEECLVHDVTFVFHELGHNFNAKHTHEFDPPIDCCVAEGNCHVQDCNDAPSTIMSYCHNCPGGNYNILWQFHPLNISRMEVHVACLRSSQNPCYVDWRNTSGTEDGTATNPYNTVKEGIEAVLPNGMLSIANGSYQEADWLNLVTKITIWQPMTLTATGGTVTIGQ